MSDGDNNEASAGGSGNAGVIVRRRPPAPAAARSSQAESSATAAARAGGGGGNSKQARRRANPVLPEPSARIDTDEEAEDLFGNGSKSPPTKRVKTNDGKGKGNRDEELEAALRRRTRRTTAARMGTSRKIPQSEHAPLVAFMFSFQYLRLLPPPP
ncbi:unnamed protein product [Tilletia controversa]|uniref:Uncharacterized protein n=2 Tax=Tilletia TaxID=13289 RepID=A0A8X7MJP4_9BASI|nr:hypothetical protein CF328_g8439 [Tilletia controversa]KAE8190090.1 hypothetical protein CF336_g5456 [Tilletia laevis]KAE8257348.1 hypothetical protein A4X03_0g4699 [Tilletia caries]KAE8238356.1 hypothetical protein A4X06_0g8829 [Tilletia controversa]CAD6900786.1 unnamed protein product [Tilletia laevis]